MIYNIINYGAAGNGIKDDTLAIQAAIDAAHAAGGGEVYIPGGTYIVSGHDGKASLGAIMLYDNITVYGAGMGTTTVRLKNGWSGDITGIFRDQTGVQNHDLGLHDLTIDGNRANTSGKVDGWFNGVSPGQPGTDANITLDRVEIKNCAGYGFDPHEQTTNLVITNSISHGNGLDGFTLDFQINAHVDNNISYGNDRHGFNIVTSSYDIELNGNSAYGNGAQGIMVQRGSDNIPVPNRIQINGGSLYDNGGDGVQINKADHVTVDGVDIHDNGQRGVRIMGSAGSIVENSIIHNNSQNKNLAYEEIRIESYNDTNGASGRIYTTSGTVISGNVITDNGAVRGSYSVREIAVGTDYTVVSNNTIYGTGEDTPLLSGTHSSYSYPPLGGGTSDPHAPGILYAPLLGQSNAELLKLTAFDGGSGLSHVESGLQQQTGFSQVVTMTNMAVGGSTVDGDRHLNQKPELVWWYPDQNKPGAALLQAVDQMLHQISELGTQGKVTPIVIWGQGESEANQLGTSKSDGGRQLAEQEYITSTRLVFDYIKEHVNPDMQFYIMETGNFNTKGALAFGYPQSTIDKEILGLTYVRDAQVKMALAYNDVHLAVNYSDLPMNADVSSSVPGYDPDWATDAWHLALDSKEIAADRLADFIALDMGYIHVIDNPGPYPRADLADLTIKAGPGITVTGNGNDNLITGTAGNDTISGGNGDDIIAGGGGKDVMSGGGGSDTFYYDPSVFNEIKSAQGTSIDIRDTISGFQIGSGGDIIDVSALLRATGYSGAKPVADGYITVMQQGSDAVLWFDPDGAAGSGSPVAIARLSSANAGIFDFTSNLITQFPYGNALVINLNPVAQPDKFTASFNSFVTGNVLADNGYGADSDPDGNILSIAQMPVQTSAGGSVSLQADGSFSYHPQYGFTGMDNFVYTLLDGHGGSAGGNVTISVSAPAGAIVGTNGDNSINGGSRDDIILGLNGNDIMNGGGGNDTLYGGSGNDAMNGNSGNDILYAVTGNDVLHGNDGNDTLYAGSGIDSLYGDNGNDILITGTGAAAMTGGGGADIFKFAGAGGGIDTIADFRTSIGDKIDISDLLEGYDPAAKAISDFVHSVRQGENTVLSVDRDGAANGAHFSDTGLILGVQNFDVAAMIANGSLIV